MFTRFQALKKSHVMDHDGSMVHIPRDAPGAAFFKETMDAYEEESTLARISLLANAERLRAYLTENQQLLPFRYSYEIPMFGRTGMKTKGSGSVSGILIGGEPYSITGGNGKCFLTKLNANSTGSNEQIDVRHLSKIVTDECGEIKITRRKIPFTLPIRLDECIEFFGSVPDQMIRLYSYDRPPKLRQLLQEMVDGNGGNDFAIEEVCRRGPEMRDELLSALNSERRREFRFAIIQLLLLCYPNDATRIAIEQFIEKQPSKDRGEYLALVAAFSESDHPGR